MLKAFLQFYLFFPMKTILVVVAHPDDEVLGVGGTLYRLKLIGYSITVVILSGEVEVRRERPVLMELKNNINEALQVLGIEDVKIGQFPNIQFNLLPHVEIVRFIESQILEVNPDFIFTHHPGDLNNDHYHTSIACQAAARLFQRISYLKPIENLFFMEIASSSEWSLNSSIQQFRPNTFFEIGFEGIEKKLESLSLYKGVMRPYPHPRSNEAIRGLAAYRGSQAGMNFAEAFESVFRRIVPEVVK